MPAHKTFPSSQNLKRKSRLSHQSLFSLRLLWSEIRTGKMTVILLALILAVTSATIISVFSQRLDNAMLSKSTELLGADLRIQSSKPIDQQWYQKAQDLGLEAATTLEFPSVVLLNDEMALAAIKAVDQTYPLKGTLTTAPTSPVPENANQSEPLSQSNQLQPNQRRTSGPAVGEVWLEARLLALLNAQVGDDVEVGASHLKISAIVNQESDRGGGFYSLSPRLMMNLEDIEAAELVRPGSRVNWRMLIAGDASALEQLQTELQPLLESHQRFESLTDNNQALSASLAKARSYLSLAAMLAIILAGIAIAMAAQDYARHHFDSSALLRTLGASRAYVTRVYLFQLIYLAFISTALGLLLGYFGQQLLTEVLVGVFKQTLPAAGVSAWLIASLTAPVTLLGFALPPLLRLGRVSPLRVLRRELEPMAWNSWAIYGLGLTMMIVLSYWFSQNLAMTAIVILGGFWVLLFLLFLLQGILYLLNRIMPIARMTLSLRFAWLQINRDRYRTAVQILAFALTIMVMLIIAIVRNDLLADWQNNLPDNSPNFFAMNIQSFQVENYRQDLTDAGFTVSTAYPMVPGRLVAINSVAVKDDPLYEKDPAIQRDLVLSGGANLPEGNTLVEGTWFGESAHTVTNETGELSIAEGLATRLKLKLGDELTFEVAGQTISADITSIRKVDWGSMKPNFYILFSADIVAQLPLNYLTSFYAPPELDSDLNLGSNSELTRLIRQYPGITLLDMSQVVKQVQSLLVQVTLAIEYLLVLVLFAGFLVLLAALYSSLDDRLQQGAILRTLGAKRQQLRSMQWIEFILVGGFAGIIATFGAEGICWLLYEYIFKLPYPWHFEYWILMPITVAIVIASLAVRSLTPVVKQPPLVILRKI